ncbi:MAG TPA: hypothetical protein VGE66_01990 [Chitinophagaceae bacterium]
MIPFQFYYNDQYYKGKCMISGSGNHGFFWCFLESDELTRQVGQCLIFSFSNGTLMPTKVYDPAFDALIEAVRVAVLPLYHREEGRRERWGQGR